MTGNAIDTFCEKAANFWGGEGINLVSDFLIAALVLAVLMGILALIEKSRALWKTRNSSPEELKALAGGVDSGLWQALAGIIDALVKAPVWFALFLAALALAWTGAASMDLACGSTKSTDTKESKKTITLTEPGSNTVTEERTTSNTVSD